MVAAPTKHAYGIASAGSRTRVTCLEGRHPNRWTTDAPTIYITPVVCPHIIHAPCHTSRHVLEHPEKYSVESPCGGLVRARQKQAIAMHPDDVDTAGECAVVLTGIVAVSLRKQAGPSRHACVCHNIAPRRLVSLRCSSDGASPDEGLGDVQHWKQKHSELGWASARATTL